MGDQRLPPGAKLSIDAVCHFPFSFLMYWLLPLDSSFLYI